MQRLHYSIYTERSYCNQVTRYIRFHHLQERTALLIEPEKKVEDFLTHLAVQANAVLGSDSNTAYLTGNYSYISSG